MAKRMSVHFAGEVPKENQAPKTMLFRLQQDESGKLHTRQTLEELFESNRPIRMGTRRI